MSEQYDKLIAIQDTLLVIRPLQSSILLDEQKPGQVYRIPEGTELSCARLDWHEGENVSSEVDGDDYFWPQLIEPLPNSNILNWFGYARHFKAIEADHPEMTDEAVIVDEDKKKTVANLVKSASNTAMNDQDSEQKKEDLGPTIQLPGAAFQRPRHIYEPVFWVGDKPAPFTWAEFTKGGTRIPVSEGIAHNVVKTAKMMTFFREVFAQPIEITSGYRDPQSNRAVGGARYSRHLDGDAVDWKPMADGITQSGWDKLRSVMLGGGLAISGYDGEPEYGFFHTDRRGGGDPLKDRRGRTFWTYPNSPSWVGYDR